MAKTGAKVGGKLNFLNKNIQTDSFDRYKRTCEGDFKDQCTDKQYLAAILTHFNTLL